jgi:hypothetical protein
MSFVILDRILRSPGDLAKDLRADRGAREIAKVSLLAVGAGATMFGAVIGTFHGGAQIVFSAVKMPLALLGALIVAAPAFFAFAAACGRYWPPRSLFALALIAGARAALVLFAAAPVFGLLINLNAPYDVIKLAAALVYVLAGLSALLALLSGLGPEKGRALAVGGFAVVFLLGGAQSAWLLRPYLCEPTDTTPLAFIKHRTEGGVAGAVGRSAARIVRGKTRMGAL